MLAAAGALVCGALAVASRLDPDPRGLGTHEQLGLAPCWIHQRFGVPCPTCGMTTAWAHAVRGQWLAAIGASFGGTMLFAAAAIGAPWALVSAAAGKWLFGRPTARGLVLLGSVWLATTTLDWARRLIAG